MIVFDQSVSAPTSYATLFTPPESGLFRLSMYQVCSATGAGGLALNVQWYDGYNTNNQDVPNIGVSNTVGAYTDGELLFWVSGGNAIQYKFHGAGGQTFNFVITLEQLS